jgi:putative acetyltransferase
MPFTIRRAEPDDYEALYRIFSGQQVIWGVLQVPYPSLEEWRKRLASPPEGVYRLVACAENEVVGEVSIHTFPNTPRRRHAGQLGLSVREDWQGKRVGSSLMQAIVELADKWLNLRRLELEVYTDNEAAVRLYKKHGFTIEGTLLGLLSAMGSTWMPTRWRGYAIRRSRSE